MELEYSKSSSSELENEQYSIITNNDNTGIGRSYECIFCKRGFTTAQALGGHMNIHRKDRATNKTTKPAAGGFHFHPSSVSSNNNNNYSSVPKVEEDANNNYPPQVCLPIRPNSQHVQYSGHVFGQKNLSLYANNPLCVGEIIKDKFEDNRDQEDGVDLELRLGHHP